MVGVEVEPEVLFESGRDVGEEVGGEVDHGAAALACRVVLELVRQVVDRPAVAEVHVGDHTECLEGLEGAVHRREVDLGMAPPHDLGQLLGADVARAVEEAGQHRPPGTGDATATGPEAGQDLLLPFRPPTAPRHAGRVALAPSEPAGSPSSR